MKADSPVGPEAVTRAIITIDQLSRNPCTATHDSLHNLDARMLCA